MAELQSVMGNYSRGSLADLKLCTPVQADERVLKGSGFSTFRAA